jgi:hypothetical protein
MYKVTRWQWNHQRTTSVVSWELWRGEVQELEDHVTYLLTSQSVSQQWTVLHICRPSPKCSSYSCWRKLQGSHCGITDRWRHMKLRREKERHNSLARRGASAGRTRGNWRRCGGGGRERESQPFQVVVTGWFVHKPRVQGKKKKKKKVLSANLCSLSPGW